MDQVTTNILINYFTEFSWPILSKIFQMVYNSNPDLEEKLKQAKTTKEQLQVIDETVGIITATAESGSINIDHTILEALRAIKFDHLNGEITIVGTKIKSDRIETGGKGSGTTTISNSEMNSKNTTINSSNGSIRMTGKSKISQS